MEAVSSLINDAPQLTAAQRSRLREYAEELGKSASVAAVIEIIKWLIFVLL